MEQPVLKKLDCEVLRPRGGVLLFMVMVLILAIQADRAGAEEWPREIVVPEGEIVLYQPQLESFQGNKLEGRAAVSVTRTGKAQPVFGAVWLSSRVLTDRDTRRVTLQSVKMTRAAFPGSDPAQEKKLGAILAREIPKWDLSLSLDRLLVMLDQVKKEKLASGNLNTVPPRILFVTHPAVLISLDGDPELRKMDHFELMRVVNTPVFMVLDPASKNYYLKGGKEWFESSDVAGPWKKVPAPPASVLSASTSSQVSGSGSDEAVPAPDKQPQIIVATVPTELIVSDGEPKYSPIQGTDLLYMSNTESNVFMQIASQRYFILVSGRWFVSDSLDGPWSYVAADRLPADFAKIPAGSKKGNVLASVPGTQEAKEAVLDAYIPQTTTVRRDATITVTYDGAPEFKKITDTHMEYAVNTGESVIRVGDHYYCCHEALWYEAADPLGPWTVCVSVPREIYTIPPNYPVYNVKYVYVYEYSPTVVYVGYMPGYVGTYVYGGTVVYGTGYYYHGWYGRQYYYRPVTYGFAVAYSPYHGWHVGVGVASGVWVGSHWGGWYGGWHRTNVNVNINKNININRNNIYNRRENLARNMDRQDRSLKAGRRDRTAKGAAQTGPAKNIERKRPGKAAGRDKARNIVGEEKGRVRPARRREDDVFADRTGNV